MSDKFKNVIENVNAHSEAAISDAANCNFASALKEFGGVASILALNPAFRAEMHGILDELAEEIANTFISKCSCKSDVVKANVKEAEKAQDLIEGKVPYARKIAVEAAMSRAQKQKIGSAYDELQEMINKVPLVN